MDSTKTSPHETSSPDSASKAHSDQTVKAFHCTYGLPAIVTHRFDTIFKAAGYRFNGTSYRNPCIRQKNRSASHIQLPSQIEFLPKF